MLNHSVSSSFDDQRAFHQFRNTKIFGSIVVISQQSRALRNGVATMSYMVRYLVFGSDRFERTAAIFYYLVAWRNDFSIVFTFFDVRKHCQQH